MAGNPKSDTQEWWSCWVEAATAGVLQVCTRVVHGWGHRAESRERDQRSPESSAGSPLCLIELNLLIPEKQIENLLLSSSVHSGGTIKGDNCCLASNSRPPNIFFSFPSTQVVSGAIYYSNNVVLFIPASWSPTEPEAVAYFGNVCCRHRSEAEHSTLFAEELRINIFLFFFFALKLITLSFQSSPSASLR